MKIRDSSYVECIKNEDRQHYRGMKKSRTANSTPQLGTHASEANLRYLLGKSHRNFFVIELGHKWVAKS